MSAKSISNNYAKDVSSLNNSSDNSFSNNSSPSEFERVKEIFNIDFIDIPEQTSSQFVEVAIVHQAENVKDVKVIRDARRDARRDAAADDASDVHMKDV